MYVLNTLLRVVNNYLILSYADRCNSKPDRVESSWNRYNLTISEPSANLIKENKYLK